MLRRQSRLLAIGLVIAALWAATGTILLLRNRGAPSGNWSPDLETLWAPFLESKRSILLCLGAPLFVRIPNYGFFRDPKANEWEEALHSERIGAMRKATGIVFIGPPKFNVHLQAASLAQDIVVEPEGIRNLKPRPGEPVFLQDHIVAGKVSEGETHALISRTAGLSGVGELLMMAGNASPDTLAAAEWLTQPGRAKELVGRLRLPSGEIPRYFQIVIKVTFKQGIPVQSSYVFHHVITETSRVPSRQ